MRKATPAPIMPSVGKESLHRLEDDLAAGSFERWVQQGLTAIESYLAMFDALRGSPEGDGLNAPA